MAVDYAALKKGGFMRQKQKGRFSLRLKVTGGNLTVEQLETIAAAARAYGDGHVHLTSRQGVEIPFVKLEDVEAITQALAQGGVMPGACGPRVRTVTACQGSEVCPSGCIETHPLAVALGERYHGRELPHKFKIGVTGCPNNCLKAEENDLGIKGGYRIVWKPEPCTLCGACVKVCRHGAITKEGDALTVDGEKCRRCGKCAAVCPKDAWEAESGYLVSFGGTFGNTIAKGREVLPMIHDRDTLFRVVDAAVEFFSTHGSPGRRMNAVLEDTGWDVFSAVVWKAFNHEE